VSDTSDVQTDTPPPGLPPHVRRLLAPWWSARADLLATLLETAVNAREMMTALEGKIIIVETVAECRLYAIKMVEALATTEKSWGGTCN
jgi:hypothetical protein